jgi:hypothetical protein
MFGKESRGRGIGEPPRGLGRWFFGTRSYAHPALKWLAGPAWRVATLMLVVIVFSDPRPVAGMLGWRIAGVVLIGISVGADVANWAIFRSRRRDPTPHP